MGAALQPRLLRVFRFNADNVRDMVPQQWPGVRYGLIPAGNNEVARKAQWERVTLESDDLLSYTPDEKSLSGVYIAANAMHPDANDYFKIEIIDCGLSGDIAIGLVPCNHPLDQLPSLVTGTLGYHSGDGKIYFGYQRSTSVTSKCEVSDRIGCGIGIDNSQLPPHFAASRIKHGGNARVNMLRLLPFVKLRVFFTSNGNEIASSMITPISYRGGLYPAIALCSPGEEVKLNLNSRWIPPFVPESISDDSLMCVDSYEDDWLRLHDVRLNGCCLEYCGRGKSILDVGLAQARRLLDTRYHYFEIEIIDPGENCYIAISLTKRDYPSRSHPGWNPGSIAYHADDGKIFVGSGGGDPLAPKCHRGDIMGCGIIYPSDYNPCTTTDDKWSSRKDSSDESDYFRTHEEYSETDFDSDELYDENDDSDDFRRIPLSAINDQIYKRRAAKNEVKYDMSTKVVVYFTRNGKTVGEKEVYIPEGGFFPTVGMLSTAEKVKVNKRFVNIFVDNRNDI